MSTASATLLVELLTEELPPKALKTLSEAFAESLHAGLARRDFLASDKAPMVYATPRRLAVAIEDVLGVARDAEVVDKLMPTKVAFGPDGEPTNAFRKKLASLGREHLATREREASDGPDRRYRAAEGSTEYEYLRRLAKGQALQRGLEEALEETIARLPIPKVMSYARSGAYYNDQKFIRPAHRLLALHGADVVPIDALGLRAANLTDGHRFLSRSGIEIASADAYAPTLEAEGKVLPSFRERRERIATELKSAAAGARVIMPEDLLDEVNSLVEWPKIYTGGFAASFLDVPHECLILTMQHNQRYFALADSDGRLQNRFLLVSNIDPRDPEAIIRGNERVLRARLADAKFFYDHDRRQPLASRVDKLKSVVYQGKLGSQADRVERLRFLATRIAPLIGADAALADRAAHLAKADLVTDMVGEFPELQGTMGRYYALHDGEPGTVAAAIEQHYWPKAAGGALPDDGVAQCVALADKLEALAGMFGIGQVPTGDKDPFGLRRAALGVVRILIERQRRVSLPRLVELAYDAFNAWPVVKRDSAGVLDFIYERLRGYLRELGYTANQVAAVVDSCPAEIDVTPARLEAVRTFEKLPEAQALAAANKRIANILRKSQSEAAAAVDRSLLGNGAEHDLYAKVQTLLPVVHSHVDRGEYTEALRALASAKSSVDRFFDDVLVMAEDPALRANRLALLRGLAEAMNGVADISKLAV
jgi:glycyl-tRNA synthetase beta chain